MVKKFFKYNLTGIILPGNYVYVKCGDAFEENDCWYSVRMGVEQNVKIPRMYIGKTNGNSYPININGECGYVRKLT